METETPPTPTKPPRTMALIIVKKKYTSQIRPLTLIENSADADAIVKIIELAGVTEEITAIDVPVWPNLRSEDDD